MKKILLSLFLLGTLLSASAQVYHTDIEKARDCNYIVYFNSNWKPLIISERGLFNGSDYKKIGASESAYMHAFSKSELSASFFRIIFLTKDELKSYVNNKYTKVSNNSHVGDYYGTGIKQSQMQRVTFMGVSTNGLDSIHSEGARQFFNESGVCTKQDYWRTYKNYELYSEVVWNDDCNKQKRGYSYSWRKDGIEIMYVFNSALMKAFFLRRPDNDSCLAAYYILEDNVSTYDASVHWVVGEFTTLFNRYASGDPVKATGTGKTSGDFMKAYLRDFQGTYFFPFKGTTAWNSLDPDLSTWIEIPENDIDYLNKHWNDKETNEAIGYISNEFAKEYLDRGGYWSAKYSTSGEDCNTYFVEDID